MKKFILSLLFVSLATVAQAQTVQQTLQYQYVGIPVSIVNTYQTFLKVDTGVALPILPICLVDTVVTTNTTCTSPIILTSGNHTITVTAVVNGQSASGTLNYIPGAGPGTPTTITITIVVKVP